MTAETRGADRQAPLGAPDAAGTSTAAPFRVALTFDLESPDRIADAGSTDALLDMLDRLGVRATMFLQGRWVEAYPALAASIPSRGHLVGNHSFYHARMLLFSRRGFAIDVRGAERTIRRIVGVDPRPWFRCPFGAGSDRPHIVARLAHLGYREVGWHVSSSDWAYRTAKPVITRTVAPTVAHGDGTVVLFHGWPRSTFAAMPDVIARLRDAGATFVRADELDSVPSARGMDRAPVPGATTVDTAAGRRAHRGRGGLSEGVPRAGGAASI